MLDSQRNWVTGIQNGSWFIKYFLSALYSPSIQRFPLGATLNVRDMRTISQTLAHPQCTIQDLE